VKWGSALDDDFDVSRLDQVRAPREPHSSLLYSQGSALRWFGLLRVNFRVDCGLFWSGPAIS